MRANENSSELKLERLIKRVHTAVPTTAVPTTAVPTTVIPTPAIPTIRPN